jgi:hypothetical protein
LTEEKRPTEEKLSEFDAYFPSGFEFPSKFGADGVGGV